MCSIKQEAKNHRVCKLTFISCNSDQKNGKTRKTAKTRAPCLGCHVGVRTCTNTLATQSFLVLVLQWLVQPLQQCYHNVGGVFTYKCVHISLLLFSSLLSNQLGPPELSIPSIFPSPFLAPQLVYTPSPTLLLNYGTHSLLISRMPALSNPLELNL